MSERKVDDMRVAVTKKGELLTVRGEPRIFGSRTKACNFIKNLIWVSKSLMVSDFDFISVEV